MNKLLTLIFLGAASLAAQTSETVFFHAKMLPSNEVPATDFKGTAAAIVIAHAVKDASGEVISGTVEFHVAMNAAAANTYTGLHIHNGRAGENAGVVINSGITPREAPGNAVFAFQTQIPPDATAALTALRGMLKDPSGYYINIHTSEFPGGAVRAQLERAQVAIAGTTLSPRNEVPALPESVGSGRSMAVAVATFDANGTITGGAILLTASYNFGTQVTLTGYHIHESPAGVNGPVIVNSSIAFPVQTLASGQGSLTSTGGPAGFIEIDMTVPAQVRTLNGIFFNPANFYMNIHTTQYPGGAIRGQLRRVERIDFPVLASPANEVPAITGVTGNVIGTYSLGVLRAGDGSVEWAMSIFDANYRFGSSMTFTGMHVHEGAIDASGPVRLDSGIPRTTSPDSGMGNVYLIVPPYNTGDAIAAADKLVANPAGFYFNIHNTDYPAGVARAQLQQPSSAAPVITAIVSSNLDPSATTLAPGSLFTIFGRNLSKLAGTLDGWQGTSLPTGLNGAAVGVGSQLAPVLYVSPTQINAQMPFEASPGRQSVAVNNGSALSAPASVTVAAAAPAVFLVVRVPDFTPVTPLNPAAAGDVLVIASTGLGVTTPKLATGALVTSDNRYDTATATVTIAGQNVPVVGSAALPGFAGVYITGFVVPGGITAGTQPVVLSVGGASSSPYPVVFK